MILILAAIFGAIFGSFANMLIYRLPRGMNVVRLSSHCTKCKKPLGFLQLIPILSWIFLFGRCWYCRDKILKRYLIVELINLAAYVYLFASFGVVQAALLSITFTALLIIFFIDLEHMIIPDSMQIVLFIIGIIYIVLGYSESGGIGHHALSSLAAFVFAVSIYFIGLWYKKQEAMGIGDVKFFAVAGLWTGFINFIPFLFLSGVAGILTSVILRKRKVPFAPSMIIALIFVLLFPNPINILSNLLIR